jgi:hypothetical protein
MNTTYVLRTAFAGAALVVASCGSGTPSGPLPYSWPPTVGETYPDVELRDTSGALIKLSSFRGKVLLIEPIGMT